MLRARLRGGVREPGPPGDGHLPPGRRGEGLLADRDDAARPGRRRRIEMVNAAIEVAAQPWRGQIRVIDTVPIFTPGGALQRLDRRRRRARRSSASPTASTSTTRLLDRRRRRPRADRRGLHALSGRVGEARYYPRACDPLPRRGTRRPDLRAPGSPRSPTPTRSRPTSAARSPTSRSRPRRAGAEAGLAGAAGDDEWGQLAGGAARARGRRPALLRAARGRADADRLRQLRRVTASRAFRSTATRSRSRSSRWRRGSRRRSAPPSALVYSSTTLATPGEREVTLRARELALERGARVCFDPNIRPNRWGGEVRRRRPRPRAS